MRHNIKITIILLSMFLITQFIGLYVINSDPFHITEEINNETIVVSNPSLSWIQPPEVQQQSDFGFYLGSLIFAFIFAILLFFLLTRFKIDSVLRAWFFVVIIISLFITFNAIFPKTTYFAIGAGILAIALAFIKTYRRNMIIHNLTELLIYPGIATIFVPILNFWTVLVLLVIISVYDMWAVWHSGIMQKMAKYQMNTLKVFSGFFVPYVSKKVRMQINKMKKSKSDKKIKVNLAILGGGDVVFPIITAGVILQTASINLPFGLPAFVGGLIPALFVTFGAFIGLALLFSFSEKKKFYPAMPFITAGIFLGIILSYLFFSL
ncbi:MAG: presenilin family intramembrane aspartyl protease [Candidatus Pacearchaeota archaeon]